MNPKGLLSRFTFFLLALALLALAACEKFQAPTTPENTSAQQSTKVKAGTYVESTVMVDVAGVRIMAQGAATLQGSFIVSANNVQIEHFTIVASADAAIFVGAVSGVGIKDNEISNGGSSSSNVFLDGSTDCTVKHNEMSGASF